MNTLETFLPAFIGGSLIALSCLILMFGLGKITGISGIFSSVIFQSFRNFKTLELWKIAFILGLVLGGTLTYTWLDFSFPLRTHFPTWALVLAGLFVGYGTQLGNGCTSGHGICGISRFSKRSIIATLTFMVTAIVTVFISRHLLNLFN